MLGKMYTGIQKTLNLARTQRTTPSRWAPLSKLGISPHARPEFVGSLESSLVESGVVVVWQIKRCLFREAEYRDPSRSKGV